LLVFAVALVQTPQLYLKVWSSHKLI